MARKLIGLILDSGALIAADRNDRQFWAFWKRILQKDLEVDVPATVLAQAWRGAANARMALVLKACGIEPLSERDARAAGELCGRAGTSDVVDSHVVLTALGRGYDIVTSDPDDLRLLASLVNNPPRILDLRRLTST